MGFADGIADGMLEGRAASAESDARRAVADLRSERDRFDRQMRGLLVFSAISDGTKS